MELQHDVVTLGRNPDNRIVISSSYISGYHARFNRVKGTDAYEITDLQSHNGTRINGNRIETQLLCHGDMIQLGPALLARFEQEPQAVAEMPGSRAAPAAPEVKASVTYNGSGHGGRTGPPVAEASLLAEQRDELEQLKVEAKKRRNELRVGEAQLKEVRTERDTLLEAIAEAHREQAKVRDAAFAQDGVLRSGRETQTGLESGIRQLKETQERERLALQKLRAEWAEYAAKHQEIQINLEAARRDCLTIAGQAEQQREAQDTMARKVAARREEEMHLDKEAKALSEEQDLLQAAQAERAKLGAASKTAEEELRGLEASLTRIREEEHKVSGELARGRADLAALQKTITLHRETQKTLESAMAELRDQAVASEAQAEAAQTGLGETAAELESTQQVLVTAEKQLGQQQALVQQASHQLEALQQAALAQNRELAAAQDKLQSVTAQWQARHEELRNFDLKIAQAKPQLAAAQHELATRAKEQEAFQAVEARKAAMLEEVRQLEARHAALQTSHARLEAACQDLAGTRQQILEAGAQLSQLNQAIGEAEAAATLPQLALDRKLAEGESRLKEWEALAAEHCRQIAQPPPLPAGPGPDAAKPEETSVNPTEPAASIEEELIRLGFRVQPVKKHSGNAK